MGVFCSGEARQLMGDLRGRLSCMIRLQCLSLRLLVLRSVAQILECVVSGSDRREALQVLCVPAERSAGVALPPTEEALWASDS